jgi:hypothetical protein
MITLTLGSLSITVLAFMEAKPPRVRVAKAENQRSAQGTLIAFGSAYELPFMWELQALVTIEDWKKLELIAWEHDSLRRSFQNSDILAVDTFQPIREKLPRSRALAPGTTETTITTGYVEYFAQYYVWLSRHPEFIENVRYESYGECVVVQLSLQETDERVPD